MSYSQSTRTVRTYYSSGGGAPQTRTEVSTRTYGGSGQPSTTFTVQTSGGDGDRSSGSRFTNDSHPAMSRISSTRSVPVQRGYKSGWSTRKDADPARMLPKQDPTDIRSQCQGSGSLFEDPEFPAVDASLFYSQKPPRPFVWKRPSEFVDDPQLFVGGASRFDVKQGMLGDCWLLAAVASLSLDKSLLYKVVPPEQTFDPSKGYCGMFTFHFWQYGKWVDVVVDDRLPTYNDQLVFLHSDSRNEFWSALLEKAYAKLMGSYEALKGGSTTEAMEDFTGGVTEAFELSKRPPNLFQIMLKARERRSLMGCSINAKPGQLEAELSNGLIMGHAYSITNVKKVDLLRGRRTVELVRVRNPWGNEAEWKGAWGDKSPEWSMTDDAEKEELGLTFDDDGEFWMSFDDFASNFQKMEICNLGPDVLMDEDRSQQRKTWSTNAEDGQWIRGCSAGGCRNYLDTFASNPQFRITVTDPDDDDDDDLCTVIIGLMQKERRKKRKEGLDLLTLGYSVYKLKDDSSDSGTLDVNFFKYNASHSKSTFINTREVCCRHRLEPGTYAIIPSTFEPNNEGDFLLRIFSEKANTSSVIDEDTSYEEVKDQKKGGDAPEPTPQENEATEKMRAVFRRIAGVDMEVDAYELRDILNAAYSRDLGEFSLETCRSMVAMKDEDHSGKLGFDEFQDVWNDLRLWKGIFHKYDKDGSGTLSSYELRSALNSAGYRVRNATFNCLVKRYSNQQGVLSFDDFILCFVRLKSFFETFLEKDAEDSHRKGQATFSMDEFVQMAMYS